MSKKLIFLIAFVLVLALAGTNAAFASRVWENRISSDADDVEENLGSGDLDTGSSDLEMPDGQLIGLRFSNVDVPSGATIENAWIQFVSD
ncbi:unnamed protein product, partial [marine sediment metagenome]